MERVYYTNVSVRLPIELVIALDRFLTGRELSRSAILTEAINTYLETHREDFLTPQPEE